MSAGRIPLFVWAGGITALLLLLSLPVITLNCRKQNPRVQSYHILELHSNEEDLHSRVSSYPILTLNCTKPHRRVSSYRRIIFNCREPPENHLFAGNPCRIVSSYPKNSHSRTSSYPRITLNCTKPYISVSSYCREPQRITYLQVTPAEVTSYRTTHII